MWVVPSLQLGCSFDDTPSGHTCVTSNDQARIDATITSLSACQNACEADCDCTAVAWNNLDSTCMLVTTCSAIWNIAGWNYYTMDDPHCGICGLKK